MTCNFFKVFSFHSKQLYATQKRYTSFLRTHPGICRGDHCGRPAGEKSNSNKERCKMLYPSKANQLTNAPKYT